MARGQRTSSGNREKVRSSSFCRCRKYPNDGRWLGSDGSDVRSRTTHGLGWCC